ncbi:MAG: histidine kinase [Acidimicrobiia bacterium]|nr:histidine kinase [Acidimicrobiia bacterium]
MIGLDAVITDTTRVTIGRLFAVFSVVLGAAGMVVLTAVGGWDFLIDALALNFGALAIMLGFLTWLMIPAQGRNGSVWAIAWAAVFAALFTFGLAVAVLITERSLPGLTFADFEQLSPADLPTVASFAVSFRFWPVVPAFWLPLTLGLLLFPNGHPPTPRWKWVGWWSILAIALATTSTAIAQNPWSTLPISSAENTVPGVLGSLNDAGFALASMAAVVAIASLVVRYRRSLGIERSQIRWIALGGGIYAAALIIGGNFPGSPGIDALGGLVAQSALVASYGIAITKYRLYDIDVVISKTVTYGVLAGFITGVYAVIVVGVGSLVGSSDEPNLALSIAAVAIVAVAFEPLRRRVQHWANVLVYGRRATPYEVLSNATARLAGTRDPDDALTQLTDLIGEGTGASTVVLWLAVGDVMLPRSAAPHEALEDLASVVVADGDLAALPGDRVISIRHRGEVLGALSITKAKGDSVNDADDRLLSDVAAGAGVLLRNIGLNAELADRADQLRISRRRLVAAQDAERHRLERDLHDGAQQQVVALKVKLGIARTLAEREGAETVAAIVATLADTTQQAVDGMRAVAHGIYPPLLEAEGLAAALSAARRTISIPVDIAVTDLDRYERSVEESVYFAVLGTVTDAVDAGATLAAISLDGSDDGVRFVVDADVAPGDLVSITDRIDALGGVLTTTGDATGQRVTGIVPSAPLVISV